MKINQIFEDKFINKKPVNDRIKKIVSLGICTVVIFAETIGNLCVRSYAQEDATLDSGINEAQETIDDTAEDEIVTSIKNFEYYEIDLTEYEIPESVIEVGIYAFAKSESLEKIDLSVISYISTGMFYGCSSLKDVVITDSITAIGNHAFADCVSMEEISIPKSVTEIGINAFSGCKSLSTVTMECDLENVPQECFKDCENLSDIKFNGNIVSIDRCAFSGCISLYNVILPDGINSIMENAFSGCSNMLNITIPKSVTYIGDTAFDGCADKLNIVGESGSYAEKYADSHGINFTEQEVVEEVVVEPKDLTKADAFLDEDTFVYDKKAHRPEVKVSYNGEMLVEGIDYSLVYNAVKIPGTHKAIINGMGDFKGKKTLKFNIFVTPAKSFKVKNLKKKTIRIRAKKYYSGAKITGYQIAYKKVNDSKYTKKRIKTTGKLETKIEKLKKKDYNVRVRCYVKYGKKKYYSTWTKVKTLTVKK